MWHCGACNYRVRPQSVVMVRNEGALQPCDSCQRILYLED
jgi:predicted  nucleic acid-binding Zn-ribbon protein